MIRPLSRLVRLSRHVCLAMLALACAACSFDVRGIATDDPVDAANANDGSAADGPVMNDAMPMPMPDGPCWSWDPAHFDPCDVTATSAITLDEYHVYDTDAEAFTTGPTAAPPFQEINQSDGTNALMISVTDFTITTNGELRVVGTRPLIVAASGAIQISGPVDVSSTRQGTPGAGANNASCNPPMPGENDAGGGGGGGGGGFQGMGGDGGPGDLNDNNGGGTSAGGAGGAAAGAIPATVRGGCPSAAGGDGGGSGANPVNGGGAVQFTAQGTITVDGTWMHAGGAGGIPGPGGSNGASGGGSGGYIGFDAPAVSLMNSTVAANGGAGSEGGGIGAGNPGGESTASADAALGGFGNVNGGNGGNGSAGTTLEGETATQHEDGGGGGGGGGAGYIVVRTDTYTPAAVVLSPPESRATVP